MDWLRRHSVAIAAAGAALAVVGVLGLALGWGSTSAPKTAAAVATTSTSSTTTTSVTNEDPKQFYEALKTAQRNKDITFLIDRLHPVVISRYGTDQCRQFYANSTGSLADTTFVNALGPQTFDYTSDGQTASVSNTYVVTVQGSSGSTDLHFALVNGRFTFFGDCGTPVTGG